MALKVSIKVDKLAEANVRLKKRWTAVKKRIQIEIPNYLRRVQQTAQSIVRDEAFSTGALYSSIKVHIGSDRMSGTVGPDRRTAPYAEFVEFGHFLQPWGNKNAKSMWIAGVYYMTRAIAYNRTGRKEVVAALKDSFRNYDAAGGHLMPEGRAMQSSLFSSSGRLIVKRVRSARIKRRAATSTKYRRVRNKTRRTGQTRLKYNISRRK